MIRYFITFCTILWFVSCSPAQNEPAIIEQFNELNTTPSSVVITNDIPINNEGGHLQGAQHYSYSGQDYVLVSGSSSTYSYYAVVRMNENPQVISVNRILEKPFKHAGGFQLFEDYLAVGIEDNEERTRSKVYLYHLDDPENPPKEPIAIITREGAYERATAGAVGLTRVEDRLLFVVADWDSRYLDFYISRSNDEQNHPTAFQKVHTLNTGQIDKEDWSDPQFHSYQNLNLIGTSKNKLFLIGLGENENGENVADLFTIATRDLRTFSIQKIASRTFQSKNGANFRSAAGVYFTDSELKLISTTDHITEKAFINIYHPQNGQ